MNKDQIKGTVNESTGTLQKELGKATGGTEQQGKGLGREVAGKTRRLCGQRQGRAEGRDQLASSMGATAPAALAHDARAVTSAMTDDPTASTSMNPSAAPAR